MRTFGDVEHAIAIAAEGDTKAICTQSHDLSTPWPKATSRTMAGMFMPSVRRCAPGFWKKTGRELGRATKFALNLEGLHMPIAPYPIFDFADLETITTLKTMTDQTVGGFSTAGLTQKDRNPSSNPPEPSHILFHGNISTKLPANRPDIQRTGYAAWRNQDRGRTLFGDLFWDVDSYMYLALRVKSDGRKYFVNIQTDSIVESDIHQHRLYTKYHKGAEGPNDPGQWETVWIKIHEFVRTNHGIVTEPQSEMLRQKVKSVGIGLIDRQPGPFELGIAAIWATNLNERGQIDGRTGWQEGDQGSARLSEVTEEKLAQKAEEKRQMPQERKSFRERVPHFGKVGTKDASAFR